VTERVRSSCRQWRQLFWLFIMICCFPISLVHPYLLLLFVENHASYWLCPPFSWFLLTLLTELLNLPPPSYMFFRLRRSEGPTTNYWHFIEKFCLWWKCWRRNYVLLFIKSLIVYIYNLIRYILVTCIIFVSSIYIEMS